ncbi:MFS transporter [Paenibacillus koleovorans]|uniref:MFS transporter n=1 Tax=Paenibacillus koleovorans TaxID=121608 RepID=UPI000FD81A42|nr:MFS transporter [Paenibacillus koleovorans]
MFSARDVHVFRYRTGVSYNQDTFRTEARTYINRISLSTHRKPGAAMKPETRIYLDAVLQNIKSVAFFTFLGVLIARLGASDFEIALSNSLPAFFCALTLAFFTRQLPVTRGVFLISGYVRQFAFICMALSILLPNPIPVLFTFWAINAVSVIVTAALQPAILRRVIEPNQFPTLFSRNKIIGITIMTAGGFLIGFGLDATDQWFPYNYVGSMLLGCLATFTGMALIASMAPRQSIKFRIQWVRPFQDCDRNVWWIGLNTTGVHMVAPLFTIYHVKTMHLSNTQIGYFVVVTGIVSALALPLIRMAMNRFGATPVYAASLLLMVLCVLPYGFVSLFPLLLVLQAVIGLGIAVAEVSTQTIMMRDADKHRREMAYFSDFQLVMHVGMAVDPLISGALLLFLPLWACFLAVATIRLAFFAAYRWLPDGKYERPVAVKQALGETGGLPQRG